MDDPCAYLCCEIVTRRYNGIDLLVRGHQTSIWQHYEDIALFHALHSTTINMDYHWYIYPPSLGSPQSIYFMMLLVLLLLLCVCIGHLSIHYPASRKRKRTQLHSLLSTITADSLSRIRHLTLRFARPYQDQDGNGDTAALSTYFNELWPLLDHKSLQSLHVTVDEKHYDESRERYTYDGDYEMVDWGHVPTTFTALTRIKCDLNHGPSQWPPCLVELHIHEAELNRFALFDELPETCNRLKLTSVDVLTQTQPEWMRAQPPDEDAIAQVWRRLAKQLTHFMYVSNNNGAHAGHVDLLALPAAMVKVRWRVLQHAEIMCGMDQLVALLTSMNHTATSLQSLTINFSYMCYSPPPRYAAIVTCVRDTFSPNAWPKLQRLMVRGANYDCDLTAILDAWRTATHPRLESVVVHCNEVSLVATLTSLAKHWKKSSSSGSTSGDGSSSSSSSGVLRDLDSVLVHCNDLKYRPGYQPSSLQQQQQPNYPHHHPLPSPGVTAAVGATASSSSSSSTDAAVTPAPTGVATLWSKPASHWSYGTTSSFIFHPIVASSSSIAGGAAPSSSSSYDWLHHERQLVNSQSMAEANTYIVRRGLLPLPVPLHELVTAGIMVIITPNWSGNHGGSDNDDDDRGPIHARSLIDQHRHHHHHEEDEHNHHIGSGGDPASSSWSSSYCSGAAQCICTLSCVPSSSSSGAVMPMISDDDLHAPPTPLPAASATAFAATTSNDLASLQIGPFGSDGWLNAAATAGAAAVAAAATANPDYRPFAAVSALPFHPLVFNSPPSPP